MEDRVALDGVLLKCDQGPPKMRDSSECENARVAIERMATQNVDPAVEKKRQEEFERAREQLRLAQDKQRQEQEARTKVDAYSLPVVPVEPTPPPPKGGAGGAGGAAPTSQPNREPPPTAGTTTP